MALYVHIHGGLHDPKYHREPDLYFKEAVKNGRLHFAMRPGQLRETRHRETSTCHVKVTKRYPLLKIKNSEVITLGSFKSFQLGSQSSAAQQSQTCSQQEQQMHYKNGLNAISANQ